MTNFKTQERFGVDAHQKLVSLICVPPFPEASLGVESGQISIAPAASQQVLGSLAGLAIGEALGEPVEDRSRQWIEQRFGAIQGFVASVPSTGSDTALALLTVQAVIADSENHPQALAQLISQATIQSRGQTLNYTRNQLRAGVAWWNAAAPDSAGIAGPARCAPLGLLWPGDPKRAGFEAAVSCAVTHGHPSALAGAGAIAAAVSTAVDGADLDAAWMRAAADIADEVTNDRRVSTRIRMAADLLGHDEASALDLIGTGPVSWEGVPAALWCATNATSPIKGVLSAVNAGGDTDTIASMVGSILGAKPDAVQWPHAATQINGLDEIHQMVAAIADASSRESGETPSVEPAPATDENEENAPVSVSFLLDRSGSMNSLAQDVIGGFNAFVANQRTVDGSCLFTAAQFDGTDPFELLYDRVPITDVSELDSERYQPRGNTPLFDAIATLINNVENGSGSSTANSEQLVVVFTDGLENASRNWTRDQVFALIEQKKAQGWTFVFMGANQDAYAEGSRIGFQAGNVQNFRGDGQGMREAWSSVDRAVGEYREASFAERGSRRSDFFTGIKEADLDHSNR
ncbi:MAG: ADP-ribosylglycohydrolase family protein [Actinomycetota bacterium]|nr:ADP-ribosylglycohydrolase family protein [Actinomycetota bacterium]